jgi:hypothetical protein
MHVKLFHGHYIEILHKSVQLYLKCVQFKYSYNPTDAGEILSSVGVSKIEKTWILKVVTIAY